MNKPEILDIEAQDVRPFDHVNEGEIVVTVLIYESGLVQISTAPVPQWTLSHMVDPDDPEKRPLSSTPASTLHNYRRGDKIRVARELPEVEMAKRR